MKQKVYFVTAAGKTKVGVAIEPEQRLVQIQACCPVEAKLVHASRDFVAVQPRLIESLVWRLIANRWSHGEWFHGETDETEARSLIASAMELGRVDRKPSYYLSGIALGHGRVGKMRRAAEEQGLELHPLFGRM